MTFVQIIEYQTSRDQEMDSLFQEWLAATDGTRMTLVTTHARDRDHARRYVDIVEFSSYEEAMRNNDLPATHEFAERMRALCDTPPRFLNLDVLSRVEG